MTALRYNFGKNLFPALFACGLLLLPITSQPLLASLARTNAVAPPALLFFAILAMFWLVPYAWRGGAFPGQVKPFAAFLFAALFSSALAFFRPIPPFRESSILEEIIPAIITLGMGAVYYFVTAAWAQRTERLAAALRWVNYGGVVLVGWSLLQGGYILFAESQFPAWMSEVQGLVSTRLLFYNRITGLAFEPSWLAHQLNTFYIPLWLAASLSGFSAHRRLWKLSLENVLLGLAIFILYFSFSRVGWLSFFLVLGVLTLEGVGKASGSVQQALLNWVQRSRFKIPARFVGYARLAIGALLALLVAGVFVASGVLMIQYGGRLDFRLEGIVERVLGAQDFYDLVNRLFIAERVIYWEVGWRVFALFPLFGVGLGNAGFFFPTMLTAFGWRLVEIKDILFRLSFVPNTKSLWPRLLSETGMVGFSLFAAWLYSLWQSGRLLRRLYAGENNPQTLPVRVVAWAGQLAIVAFLIEGFSVDTFALPYIWVMLGLLSAAAGVSGKA